MKKLVAAAAVCALACGCISVNQNDGGNDNLKVPVVKDVVHAKYSIGDKEVSARDKMNCLFGFITWGSSASHIADGASNGFSLADKVKNGAYANACDAGKCDEIVGAHYRVKVDDYFVFATATAEVKGYPAKVTGVELITDKDPAHAMVGTVDDKKFAFDLPVGLLSLMP